MSSYLGKVKNRQSAGNGRGRKALLLGSFLLSLSLVPALCSAGPFANLDGRQAGLSDKQVVNELRRLEGDDPEAKSHLDGGPKAARAYIALRANLEGADPVAPPKIGPAPGGERIASSWLARTLERLKTPKLDLPESSGPPVGVIGPWATMLMWGILGILLGLAVFFLVRYVRFPSSRGRKALVDAEEPVRSADAWLEEANAQIARGEYRAAVRGLYVAGLMRLDEAGVARFDRHQTNWEHLRRIEASSKAPSDADVRGATGRFDRLWYGLIPATEADAHAMRAWYDTLVRRLAEHRTSEPRSGDPRASEPRAAEAHP